MLLDLSSVAQQYNGVSQYYLAILYLKPRCDQNRQRMERLDYCKSKSIGHKFGQKTFAAPISVDGIWRIAETFHFLPVASVDIGLETRRRGKKCHQTLFAACPPLMVS